MEYQIEAMRPADWDAVRTIYLEGIATGNSTFETSAPEWESWDARHLPYARLVARVADGTILGWAALSPISSRKAYAGVADVSIYIAASARGQGVGSALLGRLVAESEARGLWTLQAGIFATNAASIRLHEAAGFRLVGRRERIAQLHGVWKDTVLMERRSKLVGVE